MHMRKKFDPTGYAGLALTLVFSLIFVFHTFGLAFVSGHSTFWDAHAGDRVQHLAGLNMYLLSQWQFPLLNFNALNYPYGGNVAFVDGIPIFAFLLKVFLPRNIGFINPLGYWVALNCILQIFSAWWITRELQVKSWAFLFFLILTLCTYPVWMHKMIQVALMSHWIVLFAIALYLRGYKKQKFSVLGWSLLLFFSFYIHLYLFAMAFCFYLASALEAKHSFTRRHIFSLFLPLIILGASLFIFFLPLPPNLKPASGFDYFAMNLLSPFQGAHFYRLKADFSHSPDGFNYLGLGVIISFIWVALSQSVRDGGIFRRHWGLCLILLGCFMYSLSSQIYFGGKLIATVNYPHIMKPITSQLRCSGRFFWPVGYMIVIFSIYMLYSRLNRRMFTFIACLLLVIQAVDIRDYYSKLIFMAHYDSPQPPVNYDAFDRALQKQDKYLYLYPKFSCADINGGIGLAIMRYAAERQLVFNTGYFSRFPTAYCHDMNDAIARSDKNHSMYMFLKMYYPNVEKIDAIMGNSKNVKCQDIDFVYICHYKQDL